MTRRRTKSIHKPEVIQESHYEELEHAETKSDVSDSLEMQIARKESTTVHPAQSVAELQADGDVSETESNCSAVSGVQTPLFVRVTRRRQIVVPYQPDCPDKKRQDKTAFAKKLSRILDEEDVSEAESCSSAVSGVQMPSVTRTTRSRQSKKKLKPDAAREVQSEDISDAESCCLSSGMELCITPKRVTRSMQMKSQAENIKQTEKGRRFVLEGDNLIEDTVKSQPVIISDSRPAAELVPDTEDASSVTEDNREPSSPKSKYSSESANATRSKDVKEEVLNDVTPVSLTKMKQSDAESPGKKAIQNTQSVGVDGSEEARGQTSSTDCVSPKQCLESQGQISPKESKRTPECQRADAETDAQQSFTRADALRKGEQASAASSPQKDVAVAQGTDSVGRCRVLEITVGSGEDQAGEYAESVSHSSERSSTGNNSLSLFLSQDEGDESENGDVADIDIAEESLRYKEADEKTPSLNKSLKNSSLHAEGLFVIDTEPGMSSSQKYYLDQVDQDQDSDAESKHEGSEKGEESSDLEEAGEELIDEDEKGEDDDLLKTKIDV
ncbi:PREDICTED: deoxynucleotidyltransferase terminal-interacting protein 2-like [Leptosomus discolor]|uniref:deoxynucleotidyltransferase terminal-interacting protein 2-like n=1 Tax=Leptosomus discolor TaxID=188344 RepID=UPI000522597D|nr:PREDICTED: deoxynucleotidyltransferase terminal-interacting protein 2-like [Leptosomus discolor]